MKHKLIGLGLLAVVAAGCNKEKIFPDFEYQTVYFPYQSPVRTVTFGEDIVNTDLDNQGKIRIFAATGGVYFAKEDVNIEVSVDNTLLGNGMTFGAGGHDIIPMPQKYFNLAADRIVIPKGNLAGGVEVQLTDQFFADPLAVSNTYVIPLRMNSVTNADSILVGKDYVLYAVKYINKWHGNYLRRGNDVYTGSLTQTIARRTQFVENNEVKRMSTKSMTELELPLTFRDNGGNNVNCTLLLTFDANERCTVTSLTNGVTASGSGRFEKRGEKNSWGNRDRDAVYLNYEVNLPNFKVTTLDTLVMRDRGVAMETFTPVQK